MPRLSRNATLVLLTAAACLQQGRYLVRAVLPAQDVVDTVSVAQRMQREGLAATIRSEPVPPLFPALVATTHAAASRVGLIELRDWASPPQWCAAAALVFAVVPIFLLGERLAGRAAAVIATIFFITLPALSRLGGDGLGDALHLCLVTWGVWLFVAQRPFLSGLCIAAALLVRIEAAVVPLAVLLVAVLRSEFRVPRFFAATALCLAPYFAVGVASPTAIVERLRGGAAPTEIVPLNAAVLRPATEADERAAFGRKDAAYSARFHGLAATLDEYATELLQAFGFVLPLLIVPGFMTTRRSGWRDADMLLLVVVGLHLAIVLAMAWRGGYLSTRHFALPVVLTLPYAAVGLVEGCRRLAAVRWNRLEISTLRFQIVATTAFVVASLFVTARPLHESQRSHRAAAAWLDSSSATQGAVLDQQGFTALYSGRPTYRFDASASALADPQLAYVVVERVDLDADTPRGAALRETLGDAERAAIVFSADRNRRPRDVLIFSRPPPQLASREIHDAR